MTVQTTSRQQQIYSAAWTVLWVLFTIPMLRDAAHTTHPILGCALIIIAVASSNAAWVLSLQKLRQGKRQPTPLSVGLLLLGSAATLAAFVTVHSAAGQLLYFLPIAFAFSVPWRPAAIIAIAIAGTAYFFGAEVGFALGSLGTSVGCILGRLMVIRNEENRVLQQHSQELELTNERNRMARDLHDILGHSLTAITLKSELAGKLIDADPAAARSHIAEIENISRGALAEVRATINNYREISLAAELVQAANILHAAGIRAELPTSIDEVPLELREIFAWVLREGSTNIVRHAHATRAWVTLSPAELRIEDNGIGPRGSEGNGLRGLKERCRAQSVSVRLRPRSGGGSILAVTSDGETS